MIHKIKCILVFSFFTINFYSQDIIYKNDKSEVKSKVLEILDNEVKYKKSEFLDGPTYSMSKSDIYMIIYKNGQKEMFENSKKNLNTYSDRTAAISIKKSPNNNQEAIAASSSNSNEDPKLKETYFDFGMFLKNREFYNWIPNLILNYEKKFGDIGYGGFASIGGSSQEQSYGKKQIISSTLIYSVGARANYYFNNLLKVSEEDVQIYAGASFAYASFNTTTESNISGVPNSSNSATDTNFFFQTGARKFFGKHLGVNAELNFRDGSDFKIGVSYR